MMNIPTHAKINKSRLLASADVPLDGERYCPQSSHLRPNLSIAYFVCVRTRIGRVVTVSVIDIVNTASQSREYGSTRLEARPGGSGRPGRFASEASCSGREAMVLQYQIELSASPFHEAGTMQNAIIIKRFVTERMGGSPRWRQNGDYRFEKHFH